MKDMESIKLNTDENEKHKDKLILNKYNTLYIQTNINNIKNRIKNIFFKLKSVDYYMLAIIILNAYGIYHYLQSLNGCKNSRAYCLQYYSLKQLFSIFFLVLKAGISFSIISVFVYWELVPMSHYLLIISIYQTIYIVDHEDNFHKHGYYNFCGFLIINFIGVPLFIYLSYICKFIYQKLYKRLVYILTPAIIIIIIFYIRYFVLLNRYGYHIGLNGVKIDDNPEKYSCFYDFRKNVI